MSTTTVIQVFSKQKEALFENKYGHGSDVRSLQVLERGGAGTQVSWQVADLGAIYDQCLQAAVPRYVRYNRLMT